MENYVEVIKENLDFLFDDYGFVISRITDYSFSGITCDAYYLQSEIVHFKLLISRGLCAMLFWPNIDNEENSLSLNWIYEYYKNNGELPINKGKLLPEPGEAENINLCLEDHRQKILEMEDLLFTESFDWWELAKKYVEKKIELIKEKYSRQK